MVILRNSKSVYARFPVFPNPMKHSMGEAIIEQMTHWRTVHQHNHTTLACICVSLIPRTPPFLSVYLIAITMRR